jgi:hypothetical protein
MEDRFTKLVELVATTTKAMDEVADAFHKRVICRWGTPDTAMADNAFKGDFAALCDEHGIQLKHSLPYRHVGLVERMNRTVEECLRNYANTHDPDWDEFLPHVQFAINTSRAAAHGFTPLFVATGREPVLPIQRKLFRAYETDSPVPLETLPLETLPLESLPLETLPLESLPLETLPLEILPLLDASIATPTAGPRGYPTAMEPRLEMDRLAAEKMLLSQQKMTTYHDRKFGAGQPFAVGQWVSVRNAKACLDNRRIGPFRIASLTEGKPNAVIRFGDLPGTDWEAHQNDLLPWNGLQAAESLPLMRFVEPKEKSAGLCRQLRRVRRHANLDESTAISADARDWEEDYPQVAAVEGASRGHRGGSRRERPLLGAIR